MRLRKIVSFTLSFLFVFTTVFYYNPTNQFFAYSQTDYNNSKSKTPTVNFVSDEKIEISSYCIDYQTPFSLSQIPIIGFIFGSNKKIEFIKPDENSKNLLSKELFPEGSPKPEDVQQGNLGVCYFLAALSAAVDKEPELIKSNLTEDGLGNVTVKFFNPNNGDPYYVKVQKTVPNLPEELKFLKNDCLWVQMYLKAFVASGFAGEVGYLYHLGKKSYGSAEGSYSGYSMRMITGKNTEIKSSLSIWLSNKEKLFNKIENSLSNSCCVTCGFSSSFKVEIDGELKKVLFKNHEYSVKKVYKDSENQMWIMIRNPWGDCSTTDDGTDGYLTLKFEDFCSHCGDICFCLNEKIKTRSFIGRALDIMIFYL